MPRLLPLLLLLGAVCSPAAAFISGREARQQVNDVLTEKLFAVSSLLSTIEQHVQRLESWDGSASGIESRLAALEAGQERVSQQLADALRKLDSAAEGAAAVRSDLTEVAAAQAKTAAAVAALRAELTESVSGIGESVAGLVSSQTAQHEQTRGACEQSGAQQLAEPLAELQAAVSQTAQLAQQSEQTLSSGLGQLGGRLQETEEQLERLGQELRQERQARLVTTTPAPTVDPQQAFLNSLYRSLSKRRGEE